MTKKVVPLETSKDHVMGLMLVNMWWEPSGQSETSQNRAMGLRHVIPCHIKGQLETLTDHAMEILPVIFCHIKGQWETLTDRAMEIIVMVVLVITLGTRVVVSVVVLTLEVCALMWGSLGVLGISRTPAMEMGHATRFLFPAVVLLETSKSCARVKMHWPRHSMMVYYLPEPSTSAAIRIADAWNCKPFLPHIVEMQ